MNGSYVIIFVISFAISFTIDPTPTGPEDTTDFHFSLSASDNSNNKNGKNDDKKIIEMSAQIKMLLDSFKLLLRKKV